MYRRVRYSTRLRIDSSRRGTPGIAEPDQPRTVGAFHHDVEGVSSSIESGPLERVWRGLAYGKLQPMRKGLGVTL